MVSYSECGRSAHWKWSQEGRGLCHMMLWKASTFNPLLRRRGSRLLQRGSALRFHILPQLPRFMLKLNKGLELATLEPRHCGPPWKQRGQYS